ncbi:cytochrome P450 [Amycolatopsis sp. PS_44_ISF1]|uniref:cytochrome P450 n=1 Tax=Amycolatopsis sp. PS_44_ISF1 TaxID=2974917 RepID=UPI0028DEA4A8|nr:cytochrome P450 [Amycolatopsis sp. PS_44_ISF1]MDT8912358.1 cytochrome P450 [Amycolatopsis sp. PS_44_ISF1]
MSAATNDLDDLLAPELIPNPYAVYDRWRADDPVYWNAHLDAWLVLGHDDVHQALGDHGLISSDRTVAFTSHLSEPEKEHFSLWIEMRKRMLLYNDPPRHTMLRRPVHKGMTVRLANAMRPKIEQITGELIDGFAERGEFDGIADFGSRIPVIVNSELIGIPAEDRDRVKNWTSDFISAINAGGANIASSALERGQTAVAGMREYFPRLAERKRSEPAEDLLSALVAQRAEGSEALSEDDDLVATCIVLLFAGLETALNLIGNGLLALLQNPQQLELLRGDPSLLPGAVEEILRYDGPLHLVGRRATRDFTLRGKDIAKDDKVLLMLGAANRDGAAFPDPHRLDITRPARQHVAFGYGVHYCPGAELSRIIGETAFGTVLRRLPDLALADGPLSWQPNLSFRGLTTLPLRFTPVPRERS